MSAALATWLTIAFVLLLLWRDAVAGEARSAALWLPVLWLGITGSRFVSQWMDLDAGAGRNFTEGSLIDAAYFATLILLGMAVLVRRQVDIAGVVRANLWIALFAAFGLLSVLWSDEPLIATKRWIKTLGHPVMALIILTEPSPKAALLTVLKRCAFFLLPVSVLFIKYLPEYGRGFDAWTGMAVNNGIGLTKNDLGYVCMVSGILFTWNLLTLQRLPDRAGRRREWILSVLFLGMAVWLLDMSNSATSLVTMMLGIGIMLAVPLLPRRHAGLVLAALLLGIVGMGASFDLSANLIEMLGRNPTLTDRTVIWEDVLAMQERPLLGYGFESFWLGERMAQLGQKWWWQPTQAHNGYIETYLNLGYVGLALLIATLLSAYRRITRDLQKDLPFARLRLALLCAIVVFNGTEAGFRGVGFVWTVFYIIALQVPPSKGRRLSAAPRSTSHGSVRVEPRAALRRPHSRRSAEHQRHAPAPRAGLRGVRGFRRRGAA
jgi:exopolysaccharide production protein ExoQ